MVVRGHDTVGPLCVESQPSLIHSFREHILSTHCIAGPVLGAGGTAVKKKKDLLSWSFDSTGEADGGGMRKGWGLKISAVVRARKQGEGLPLVNAAVGKTPLVGDIRSRALEEGREGVTLIPGESIPGGAQPVQRPHGRSDLYEFG